MEFTSFSLLLMGLGEPPSAFPAGSLLKDSYIL